MEIFIALVIGLALWAAVATVVELGSDGFRRVPTKENDSYQNEGVRNARGAKRRVLHG